jgi:uncharacterized protein YjbI with pentapeptide repeats
VRFEIKSRFDGRVLFSRECDSLKLCIEAAVKYRANLSGAYLSGANLSGANLSGANLSGAYLSRANLSGAYLSGAYLSRANLSGADLSRANLSGANLYGADVSGAYLSGAYLSGAYLSGADLSRAKDAELAIARTRILPQGELVGWKKLADGSIAELLIPADAKRSNAFGRKCRASHVVVISGSGVSRHDNTTRYEPGLVVECDNWEEDWTQECAGGIHFFITKKEAEAY